MLASVMPAMMIKAPIMNPCDHDSNVNLAGADGFDSDSVMWVAMLMSRQDEMSPLKEDTAAADLNRAISQRAVLEWVGASRHY